MAGVLPTLAAGFGVVAGASAAQPQSLPETVGPVLELPQFTVHGRADIPESDAWLYGSLPGFEVLSTASDRRTRRLLQEFRLFDEGLRVVWPIPRAVPARPVLLIVCGRGADFARFEAGTKPPPRGTGRATRWLQGGAQTAFVVDVATQSLDLAMPNVAMESALTGSAAVRPPGKMRRRRARPPSATLSRKKASVSMAASNFAANTSAICSAGMNRGCPRGWRKASPRSSWA